MILSPVNDEKSELVSQSLQQVFCHRTQIVKYRYSHHIFFESNQVHTNLHQTIEYWPSMSNMSRCCLCHKKEHCHQFYQRQHLFLLSTIYHNLDDKIRWGGNSSTPHMCLLVCFYIYIGI